MKKIIGILVTLIVCSLGSLVGLFFNVEFWKCVLIAFSGGAFVTVSNTIVLLLIKKNKNNVGKFNA